MAECLRVISRIHDREVSTQSLIAGLPLANGDITPLVLPRAARRCGLTSNIASQDLCNINQDLLPAILILQDNKAAVIHSIDLDAGHASLIYPELPGTTTKVPLAELEGRFTGEVIYCRPDFRYDLRSESHTRSKDKHWFWGVVAENSSLYRDILIAAVLINLFAVASPLFIMNVYDRVVPNHATHTLWVLASGLFIVLVADLVLRLMRGWFVDLAASRTDIKLSGSIMSHVLGIKLSQRPESVGSFASNLQSYDAIRSFLSSLVIVALVDLPFVLLFATIIAIIHPPLVIPVIVGALLVLIYALSAQSKLHSLTETTQKVSAQRNATLVESLNNIETVKSFSVEGKIQASHERATLFLAGMATKTRLISNSVTSGALWTQHMVALALVIIGVYAVIAGDLSQGGLIAAYLLSSRAMSPVSQAAGLVASYHQARTALDAMEGVMALETERPDNKHWVQRPTLKGSIEFRNVSFAYPGSEHQILNSVSFKIKAGEHIAILGKNGSGKSTIEKLLMGHYEPTHGSILIDGIDIRQIDPVDLRRNIGYVPQQIELFYGTLKENLLLAAPHANDETMIRVANLSGLNQLTDHHPDGFALQVGENGQRLSGGQRQSVAITRALMNNPPLLLLDEPTGALDNTSEETIKQALKQIVANKTLIVVTHRTAMLELTERILIMDAGKIVADGPKADVIEALRQGKIWSAST
ncbi:MAG: type I secretion system permease/ATPase [Pseudomonadaceae bacterium]|nr:MAG: type I secretion system permease/ATPase [Pseudomonadaceae bacterium]